jgi:hypothetical protein
VRDLDFRFLLSLETRISRYTRNDKKKNARIDISVANEMIFCHSEPCPEPKAKEDVRDQVQGVSSRTLS